jgi:hypothetical protein
LGTVGFGTIFEFQLFVINAIQKATFFLKCFGHSTSKQQQSHNIIAQLIAFTLVAMQDMSLNAVPINCDPTRELASRPGPNAFKKRCLQLWPNKIPYFKAWSPKCSYYD